MKKISIIALSLFLASCGFQKIEVENIKPSEIRVATTNELQAVKNRGVISSEDKLYVANLGTKNGGQFLAKVNFNAFKTKASVGGIPAKTASDVASVKVYLLKLPSNYNSAINKDPISSGSIYWESPSDITKNGTAINLLFTGVPGDSSSNYYVAVVAKDSLGNVISKNGNVWTGTTATYNGFNLSSTGVGVNSTSLEVTSTTPLSIAVNLLDAVGAQIDTTVNINNGSSTMPSLDGSLYEIEAG